MLVWYYVLPGGAFVEVFYDTYVNEITRLRAFTHSALLEDDVVGIPLLRMR